VQARPRVCVRGHEGCERRRWGILRLVSEGDEQFDPEQMREQMERLEQMLSSLHDALATPGQEALPNGNGHGDADRDRALEPASAYRPSTVRFDPTPPSYRIAPGAPLPHVRRGAGTLLVRILVEATF